MLNTNLPNSNTFLEFQATVIETSVVYVLTAN